MGVLRCSKVFQGECAGKPDAASASGKKVDGLIILGDMTKPYIEQIEKEGGVRWSVWIFITMLLVLTP